MLLPRGFSNNQEEIGTERAVELQYQCGKTGSVACCFILLPFSIPRKGIDRIWYPDFGRAMHLMVSHCCLKEAMAPFFETELGGFPWDFPSTFSHW
jgi:hypothetical protein